MNSYIYYLCLFRLTNLITQSMLISEIKQRRHLLPMALKQKRVGDFTNTFQRVYTIQGNPNNLYNIK